MPHPDRAIRSTDNTFRKHLFFDLAGVHYLYRRSGWIDITWEAAGTSGARAKGLIPCLWSLFADKGVPETLSSDGGTEFTQVRIHGSGRLAKKTRQHLRRFRPLHMRDVPPMTMTMAYGPAMPQERPGGSTPEPPASQPNRDEASVIEPHPDFEPLQRTMTARRAGALGNAAAVSAQAPKRVRRRRLYASASPDARKITRSTAAEIDAEEIVNAEDSATGGM